MYKKLFNLIHVQMYKNKKIYLHGSFDLNLSPYKDFSLPEDGAGVDSVGGIVGGCVTGSD